MTEQEREILVGNVQVDIFTVLTKHLTGTDVSTKEEVCAIAYEAIINAAVSFAFANGDEKSLASMLDTGTADLITTLRDGKLRAIYEAIA